MRVLSQVSPRVLIGALWLLAFSAVLSADSVTFSLGDNPSQAYLGVNVGPYPGALTGTAITEFFCLDLNKSSDFDTTYTGTTAPPSGPQEDEVAFLTSYLLSKGPPSSDPNFVKQYEGPISFAIWEIMGTLGNTSPDPNAAQFVTLAQDAYNSGLLTTAYLSNFLVFTPDNPNTVQRFITAFQDNPIVNPEPRTTWLLASGLLVFCIWRYRPRRKAAR